MWLFDGQVIVFSGIGKAPGQGSNPFRRPPAINKRLASGAEVPGFAATWEGFCGLWAEPPRLAPRRFVVANDEVQSELGAADADALLMRRYRAGDPRAFDMLYRRHRAGLYRFIAQIAGSQADADEIFQDVWMAVIRGAHRYEPQARFITYLFAIAHKRTADRFRAQFRRPMQPLEEAEDVESGSHETPLAVAFNAELARALKDAIAALPVLQREAFLMQAEAGLTIEEIAEATQTARETVKSRLRYANKKLRAALETWR